MLWFPIQNLRKNPISCQYAANMDIDRDEIDHRKYCVAIYIMYNMKTSTVSAVEK